jgi:predicted nucleic acid-binding protein
MILVDTSVLVRYLRGGSPAIREVLASADCAICGVTRAEILHGARSADDVKQLRAALDALPRLPVTEVTWDLLGENLSLLRVAGLPMPFQDVLIATVAIENCADLWSYDSHFVAIRGVLVGLTLFDGPQA